MADVPGSLFWPTVNGLSDVNGLPLAGGFIRFFIVGTATPKAVYHDVDLTTAWTQPVELDDTGRATIYLEPGGYSATVTDAAAVSQPIDLTAFEDIGQTFFDQLNTGGPPTITQITASGYTVVDTDQVITVTNPSGTDPFIVNLLPSSDFIQRSLTIKNLGEKDLSIVPDGFDTLDLIAGPYTVPGSVIPMCPSIVITTNPGTTTGNWFIESGLGIV
jgi:hypothetical protein